MISSLTLDLSSSGESWPPLGLMVELGTYCLGLNKRGLKSVLMALLYSGLKEGYGILPDGGDTEDGWLGTGAGGLWSSMDIMESCLMEKLGR